MNTRHSTTQVCQTEDEFVRVTNQPEHDIDQIRVAEDGSHIIVSMRPQKEVASRHGSLLIAAFTTAMGRIKLYRKLLQPYMDYACYTDVSYTPFRVPLGTLSGPARHPFGSLTGR